MGLPWKKKKKEWSCLSLAQDQQAVDSSMKNFNAFWPETQRKTTTREFQINWLRREELSLNSYLTITPFKNFLNRKLLITLIIQSLWLSSLHLSLQVLIDFWNLIWTLISNWLIFSILKMNTSLDYETKECLKLASQNRTLNLKSKKPS